MIMELKNGNVEIELYSDVAPNHVERFKKLAKDGKYNGVVFHRVIDGFHGTIRRCAIWKFKI